MNAATMQSEHTVLELRRCKSQLFGWFSWVELDGSRATGHGFTANRAVGDALRRLKRGEGFSNDLIPQRFLEMADARGIDVHGYYVESAEGVPAPYLGSLAETEELAAAMDALVDAKS